VTSSSDNLISFYMRNKLHVKALLPGILFCGLVVLAANYLSQYYGAPAILCALLLGMSFNNISKYSDFSIGINFCGQKILRFGVALLGARIAFSQISALGIQPVLIVIAVVIGTLFFSLIVARFLKIDRIPAIIGGASVAICGVSAALAVAAVLPSNKNTENYLLCTVVGVTGFSTILMVVYPAMFVDLRFSPEQMGLFLGASIHDVAQVVAAGHMVSDEVAELATYTKMLRVASLVPVVLVLGILFRREFIASGKSSGHDQPNGVSNVKASTLLPGFLIGFIALVVLSNSGFIPDAWVITMTDLSRLCLLIAMAALGTKAKLIELWQAGSKPLLHLTLNTLFIGLLAFLLIH